MARSVRLVSYHGERAGESKVSVKVNDTKPGDNEGARSSVIEAQSIFVNRICDILIMSSDSGQLVGRLRDHVYVVRSERSDIKCILMVGYGKNV